MDANCVDLVPFNESKDPNRESAKEVASSTQLKIRDGTDYFNLLPKNVVERIFRLLPKVDLLRCELVCKRFQEFVRDASLWDQVSLSNTVLKPGAMGNILKRPIEHLQLTEVTITDPIFFRASIRADPYFQSNVKTLELRKVNCTTASMAKLLSRCHSLGKLTVEDVTFDSYICSEIAKYWNMNSLKIINCPDIEWQMLEDLHNLTNLTVSLQYFTAEEVSTFLENIPPNIMSLHLDGCQHNLSDINLEILLSRCEILEQLTLVNCTEVTAKAIQILDPLEDLRSLTFIKCRKIGSVLSINFIRKKGDFVKLQMRGIVACKAHPLIENVIRKITKNTPFRYVINSEKIAKYKKYVKHNP